MINLKKFLSLENLVQSIRETCQRFPLAVLSTVLATGIAFYLDLSDGDGGEILGTIVPVLFSAALFFSAGVIFSESRKAKPWLLQGAVALVLVGYYFSLPVDFREFKNIHTARVFLFNVILALTITLIPFWRRGTANGFWHYSKRVCLRFIFAFISSATLFAGIALSLASVNFLFGVEIDYHWYTRLWIVMAGTVAPMIFLAGLPKDYEALDEESEYFRVIKIFSQYILLPLLGLYAVILYAYGAKIILIQEWPKGLVSSLILAFSAIGIVAMLLLFPEREKSPWIKKVSKIFYFSLLPLTALLFGAIYIRIKTYGLTPDRLGVVLGGFWILAMAVYFARSEKYDIRVIHISLIALILIAVFSPWNIFSFSAENQKGRLEEILTDKKILMDGKIKKAEEVTLTQEEYDQIYSIVQLIYGADKMEMINDWFEKKPTVEKGNAYRNVSNILEEMNIKSENIQSFLEDDDSSYFNSDEKTIYALAGFDYLADVYFYQDEESEPLDLGDRKLIVDRDRMKILIHELSGNQKKLIVEKDLSEFVQILSKHEIKRRDNIPSQEMYWQLENNNIKIGFQFESLRISKMDELPQIESFNGKILVKMKK